MADLRTTAVALAALEVLPAEPSDLAGILASPAQRKALVDYRFEPGTRELTAWLAQAVDQGRIEYWTKALDALTHESSARAILAGDLDYPPRLAGCWDHPPVLFIIGVLAPSRPSVAIVGSRSSSDAVLDDAWRIAAGFAQRRWSVVSGLAAGVDGAAHSGALSAGGHTVAVMGTGIRHIFPPRHADLAGLIALTGSLVSQFTPNAPHTPTTFLRRNHVIAALADVDLVMSGEHRSGSRHQAEQAISYGRPVLLWAPALADQDWAREAVAAGAASFVDSPEQVHALSEAITCIPA